MAQSKAELRAKGSASGLDGDAYRGPVSLGTTKIRCLWIVASGNSLSELCTWVENGDGSSVSERIRFSRQEKDVDFLLIGLDSEAVLLMDMQRGRQE